MPHSLSLASLLCLCCAPALVAQPTSPPSLQLGARSFFPTNYIGEAYVDLKVLRDTELWDTFERQFQVRLLLGAFKRHYGFRLDDIDEVRAAMTVRETDQDTWRTQVTDTVTVFVGGRKLVLPVPLSGVQDRDRRSPVAVGGYHAVQEGLDSTGFSARQPTLYVVPRPGCLVFGPRSLVEPVLLGQRTGGVPDPELMVIAAVGRRKPLAYYARRMRYDQDDLDDAVPFPLEWFTEEDAPTGVMVWINTDEATEHVHAVMRLQFTDGARGPEVFEQGVYDAIAQAKADPLLAKMIFFDVVKERLVFEREGPDLLVKLSVEMDKLMSGWGFEAVMMPWFVLQASLDEDVAVAVPVVVEAPPELEVKPLPGPPRGKVAPGAKQERTP